MALFIYPSELFQDLHLDIVTARRHDALPTGVNQRYLRSVVRMLLNHDLLLVPASIEHHTPHVERIKQVAHILGIEVRSLTAHIHKQNPTVAPAARQTQLGAAVGNL